MTKLLSWAAERPKAAIGVVCVAVVVAALGVAQLKPDTSLEGLFSKNDPAAAALSHVLNHYSSADDLLLLVSERQERAEPDPAALLEFAAKLESASRASTEFAALSDGLIYRADAEMRAFFEKVLVPNGLFYLDDEAFAAAEKRLTKSEMQRQFHQNEAMVSAPGPAAQALSKAFLKDPLRLHEFLIERIAKQKPFQTYKNSDAFVSPDGRSLLIRISGKRPPSDVDFAKAFVAEVEGLVAKVGDEQVRVDYAGSYAIAAAAEKAIRHDMIVSVVSAVICLQVLFIVVYRRPVRFFLLAFTPVAAGVFCGFGAYWLYSKTFSPMTAVIGGILAGMGIDYSIQYLSQYESRRWLPPLDAARSTAGAISFGLLGAFVTSIFGFVAIGFSSVKALRDFSVLGTLGLTGAFICTAIGLPALVVLSDRRPTPLPATMSQLRWRTDGLLVLIARMGRAPAIVLALLFAAAILPLMGPGELLALESDLKVMHPQPNPALEAQAEIAKRFGTSPDALIVRLQAVSGEALVSLAHRVEERLNGAASLAADVRGTFGLASLLPDPAIAATRVARTGSAVADRVVADFRAVAAESIFDPAAFKPYEEFLRTLLTQKQSPGVGALVPYRSLARNVLPKSGETANEAITLVFFGRSLDEAAVRDSAVISIRGSLADLPGVTLTGISVLSYDAQQTVHRELPRLILIAVGIIAAYHFLHFRNIVDAMLALLPTFFSLAIVLSLMRLTNQKINTMNLVAFPLLIGINVDYGIFLLSAVRRKDVRDLSRAQLLVRLGPAVHAVLLCAASTLFGFGSLYFTRVPAIRSLGLAVAIGIVACVAGLMLLTIPMLLRLARRNDRVA